MMKDMVLEECIIDFNELMRNVFREEKNSEDLQKITDFLMCEFDEKDLNKILNVCGKLYK